MKIILALSLFTSLSAFADCDLKSQIQRSVDLHATDARATSMSF
jgi:hypothetical protein